MTHDEGRLEIEEKLFGRVIDGAASEADWNALERCAEEDADVWRRLCAGLRQEQALRRGALAAMAAADDVEAPIERLAEPEPVVARIGAGARSWGGWAVAAALLLALVGMRFAMSPLRTNGVEGVQQAGLTVSPEEALEHYLTAGAAEGLVVGEGPKLVVDSRPAADGEMYEVVFLRQVYERRLVREIYQVSEDESGEVQLTPASVYSTPLRESL